MLDIGGVTERTSDYTDQLSRGRIAADTKDPASATKCTQLAVGGGGIASTPMTASVDDRNMLTISKLDDRFGIRCLKALQ